MVLTTSSIRQQINMGLDDLICWLSMQLARIVKPMVKNEVRNMHAQELRSIYTVNKSTMLRHFDWGATKGSLNAISAVPVNVGGQLSVVP